jgi:hypothetical protein
MEKLRIFVASPGDVTAEREIVTIVVDELRRIVGGIRDVELEAVRWETHAWPDVGDDAQAVINREIGEFDIFVGVMWRRFGTPTKRAGSGTGEEFERAYALFKQAGRPKIMFYFRITPFYSTNASDLVQFRKVIRFRKKLEKAGVLFWQYDTPLEFERYVREHLIRQVLDLAIKPIQKKPGKTKGGKASATSAGRLVRPLNVFMSAVREDAPRLQPVYRALVTAGLNPWLDVQDLLPGADWEREITHAIENADVFLHFVSEASLPKKGFVQREISAALRYAAQPAGHPFIIPVRLDPVTPPTWLLPYQWVDLFEPSGIAKLIVSIRHFGSHRRHPRIKRASGRTAS